MIIKIKDKGMGTVITYRKVFIKTRTIAGSRNDSAAAFIAAILKKPLTEHSAFCSVLGVIASATDNCKDALTHASYHTGDQLTHL